MSMLRKTGPQARAGRTASARLKPAAKRKSAWVAVRYRADRHYDGPLPAFDVILPVTPDRTIDVRAWEAAPARAVAVRPDGAQVGRVVCRGQRWLVEFDAGLAPDLSLPFGIGARQPSGRYTDDGVRRDTPAEPERAGPLSLLRHLLGRLRDDIDGREVRWLVAHYRASRGLDLELPEFKVLLPVAPDELIDVHAWALARRRAVARGPDGAQIGRLVRRGRCWKIEFDRGHGPGDLRLADDVGGEPGSWWQTPCGRYDLISLRREDEPPPVPPLEVRGPGWFVIRYVGDRPDSPLPEFDLTLPADAEGQVDFHAWKAERERTVATRPSDGARVGVFLRAGHHWTIQFEPGLGPSYMRMADQAGGGTVTDSDGPFGHYRAASFRPLEP